MQRSAWQRATAIVMAVLVQGTLVGLYIIPRLREPDHSPETQLLFIQPIEIPHTERSPVAPPARNISARSNRRLPDPDVSRALQSPTSISVPEPPAPRGSTPVEDKLPADWLLSMEMAIRDVIEKKNAAEELENLMDPELRKPKLANPPPVEPATRAERLDNGDIITRHRLPNDKEMVCAHIQKPVGAHFDNTWHRLPYCNKPYSTRTGLEGIEKLKPGYLKKPVPKPRLPATAAKEEPATGDLP